MGVWAISLNIFWLAGVLRAGTSGDTWSRWILIGWVVAVKPEHVDIVVVPDGHDESHATCEGLGHLAHATLSREVIDVTEPSLGGSAVLVTESIVVLSTNVDRWSLNCLAVLDVFSLDFDNITVVGIVTCEELSDNSEWFRSVDSELASRSVEILASVSESGKVTSVLVADSFESVTFGIITAILSFASGSFFNGARMGSESL